MIFESRKQAGQLLAKRLKKYKKDSIILAIPRGGVVIGAEISNKLHLPLDLIIIRKLGAPGNPELAIGATTSKGGLLLDEELIDKLNISSKYIREENDKQLYEAKRREKLYINEDRTVFTGKKVILVDDGIATGFTVEAAVHALKEELADKIIIAVPVAPLETVEKLKIEADDVVVISTPEHFYAIGEFFASFPQVSDEEVIDLIEQHLT